MHPLPGKVCNILSVFNRKLRISSSGIQDVLLLIPCFTYAIVSDRLCMYWMPDYDRLHTYAAGILAGQLAILAGNLVRSANARALVATTITLALIILSYWFGLLFGDAFIPELDKIVWSILGFFLCVLMYQYLFRFSLSECSVQMRVDHKIGINGLFFCVAYAAVLLATIGVIKRPVDAILCGMYGGFIATLLAFLSQRTIVDGRLQPRGLVLFTISISGVFFAEYIYLNNVGGLQSPGSIPTSLKASIAFYFGVLTIVVPWNLLSASETEKKRGLERMARG